MTVSRSEKNKVVAAILALLVGFIGIHRFYLRQVGLGILYLLFSLTGISGIVAFIDFIMFLVMSKSEFDSKYNPHIVNKREKEEDLTYRKRQKPTQSRYHSRKKQYLLNKLRKLRKSIELTLKKSDNYTKEMVKEITPLMDKYLLQVEDLLNKDEKLQNIVSKNSLSDIDKEINQLQAKMNVEKSEMFRVEYEKAIERHKKRKNSIKEFNQQREVINLRLDEIEMSFEQIEYDLIKIETLTDREQRREINKMFKERSDDLGHYLEALKSTYDD